MESGVKRHNAPVPPRNKEKTIVYLPFGNTVITFTKPCRTNGMEEQGRLCSLVITLSATSLSD